MNSSEITKRRKEIEFQFRENANLATGQLNSARETYALAIEELQSLCPHIWDSTEEAILHFADSSICVICGKKFN